MKRTWRRDQAVRHLGSTIERVRQCPHREGRLAGCELICVRCFATIARYRLQGGELRMTYHIEQRR
jgi:hypothetical protein